MHLAKSRIRVPLRWEKHGSIPCDVLWLARLEQGPLIDIPILVAHLSDGTIKENRSPTRRKFCIAVHWAASTCIENGHSFTCFGVYYQEVQWHCNFLSYTITFPFMGSKSFPNWNYNENSNLCSIPRKNCWKESCTTLKKVFSSINEKSLISPT